MTYWIAAMRAVAHNKNKQGPMRRARPMLLLKPSFFASVSDVIRRLLLAVIMFAACGILLTESLSLYRQGTVDSALSEYRISLHDLAGTIRAMRTKAIAEKHPFELRIDQARGAFTVASLSRSTSNYAALERVLWLPEGLEIVETPLWITAQSNGAMTAASIVVGAAGFHRFFRLTVSTQGIVELHEESAS